jgi:hypothetical protein
LARKNKREKKETKREEEKSLGVEKKEEKRE